MSPTKPTFKPKFAAPVASSTPTAESKREGQKSDEEGDPMMLSLEKDKPSGKRAKTRKPKRKSDDRKKRETPLTDSQYDRIFESVTARVLAGDFLDLDDRFAGNENFSQEEYENDYLTKKNKKEGKRRKSKEKLACDRNPELPYVQNGGSANCGAKELNPASNFRDAISQKSPSSVKRINEVTPTLSPLGGDGDKLLIQQPPPNKKERKKLTHAATAKRKSLDYTENQAEIVTNVIEHEKQRSEKEDSVMEGVWVQCSACEKWRILDDCQDPASLPDDWICSLNSNEEFSSCSVPEEPWESSSQENYVYAEFTPGSIVWAKMSGYPVWPAMVDREPDFNSYCETLSDGNVSHYHVVFLDDRVSRAWISHRNIEAFRVNETPIKLPRVARRNDYVKELESAKSRAHEALKMTIPERIKKFSFENRFQGKSHWSRDKNSTEKKLKKRAKEKSKSDTVAPKKKYKQVAGKDEVGKGESKEEITKDVAHVSVSEDEVEDINDVADESTLFRNMVIDESHDRSDEIPFVHTEVDNVSKEIFPESNVFTTKVNEGENDTNEPLDVIQKKPKSWDNKAEFCPSKNSSNLSEERTTANGNLQASDQITDEFWLAPEKPGGVSSEHLFEDVEMQIEDEGLQSPANEADWDDFEKMVMDC